MSGQANVLNFRSNTTARPMSSMSVVLLQGGQCPQCQDNVLNFHRRTTASTMSAGFISLYYPVPDPFDRLLRISMIILASKFALAGNFKKKFFCKKIILIESLNFFSFFSVKLLM